MEIQLSNIVGSLSQQYLRRMLYIRELLLAPSSLLLLGKQNSK